MGLNSIVSGMLKLPTVIQMLVTLIVFTQLTGCSWGEKRAKSLIVIAVEGLAFESFTCSNLGDDPGQARGFYAFCEEAVRFTHAYAPSPLSSPALASIFTGVYPVEHGLSDHGETFLPASWLTVPEVAIKKGYRTAFISSGPPVLYKSGLGQGFESFRDSVNLNAGKTFRPADTLVTEAVNWLRDDLARPNFLVIYLSDLQYPNQTTLNNEGEIRSQTSQSQLEEIDESIGNLVNSLKGLGLWDSSTVVLAGLNGGLLEKDPREERGVNLYTENIQVKLLIKPKRKKRDKGLQWKVDQNVTLADVGQTLFDYLETTPSKASQYNTLSLRPVLESLENSLPEKRMIPIESAWASWRDVGIPRLSIRMNQYLYIFDKRVRFYNTIYDRLERSQIDLKDPLALDSLAEIEGFVSSLPYKRWRPYSETLREKLLLSRKYFSENPNHKELARTLKHLSLHRSWDDQVWGWRARLNLKTQDWDDLLKIGKAQGKAHWAFVALKNLKNDNLAEPELPLTGCAEYLIEPKSKISPQSCLDSTFRKFLSWASESDPVKVERKKERFLRHYRWVQLEQLTYGLNYRSGLTWSTDTQDLSMPSWTELALALPRYAGFRRQVQKFTEKQIALVD